MLLTDNADLRQDWHQDGTRDGSHGDRHGDSHGTAASRNVDGGQGWHGGGPQDGGRGDRHGDSHGYMPSPVIIKPLNLGRRSKMFLYILFYICICCRSFLLTAPRTVPRSTLVATTRPASPQRLASVSASAFASALPQLRGALLWAAAVAAFTFLRFAIHPADNMI